MRKLITILAIMFALRSTAQTYPCYEFVTHDSIVGKKYDTTTVTKRTVQYDTTTKKQCLFFKFFCKEVSHIDSTVSINTTRKIDSTIKTVSVTHDSLEQCACTETTLVSVIDISTDRVYCLRDIQTVGIFISSRSITVKDIQKQKRK